VKRDTLDELATEFRQLDKDSSGNIYKEELEDGLEAPAAMVGIPSTFAGQAFLQLIGLI